MNRIHIYMLFCIVILILYPVFYSTLTTWKITATDWIYRHSVWITQYLHNDFTPFWEYPPLFHWLMLPFVAIDFPMVLFQIIFAVMNLAVIFWFVKKEHDITALLLIGMMMATNYAYMQISSALMPQALDLLFFLPAVYLLTNKKYFYSSVLLFLLSIMHTTFLIYLAVLILFSLATKRYKFLPCAIVLVLLISPLYYDYFFTIGTFQGVPVKWDGKAQCEWDKQFYDPLWKFFAMSGLLSWPLLPYVILELKKKKFKLTEMQLLYVIWLICLSPMFLGIGFYPALTIGNCGGIWRTMSFFIIPMMLFEASILMKRYTTVSPREHFS